MPAPALRPPCRLNRNFNRQIVLRGFILGIFFFAGFGLQTLGLQFTTSSRSAFLTETLVLFIPVMSFILSHKIPSRYTVTGAALVVVGIYLLTSLDGLLKWNQGDWLTLGCAIAFSWYIIGVDLWSTAETRIALATVQAFTVSLLAVPMVFIEGVRFEPTGGLLLAMLYLIIPATLIVVMLQMRYQPLSTPSRAGVIFALEPVFAMLYALGLSLEAFSLRAALGALVVTVGVVWSEGGSIAVRSLRERVFRRV